jgi:hypothetical protein
VQPNVHMLENKTQDRNGIILFKYIEMIHYKYLYIIFLHTAYPSHHLINT